MKVIVAPIGTTGDVFPLIGLGAELAKRGHKVTAITLSEHEDLIRKSGLRFVSSGMEKKYSKLLANPLFLHAQHHFGLSAQYVAASNRVLIDLLKKEVRGETLMIGNTFEFSSETLAEKFPNVLSAKCHISQFTAVTFDFSEGLHPIFGELFAALRKRVGLDPLPSGRLAGIENHRILTEWMWPDWLPGTPKWLPPDTFLTGFPIFDGSDGWKDPAVDALLKKETPIIFTPGTGATHAGEFFQATVDAARRSGRATWLLTKSQKGIPDKLPPNVRHFPFIPLSQILSRCAALVHPGGMQTAAAAMRAGIPQIISPISPTDQLSNGKMIKSLHAGELLVAEKFTAERICQILRKFERDPKIKAGCKAVSKKLMKQDGIVEAADHLERALCSRA